MISQQRIEAFFFVMSTGSISGAARSLFLSQPSISRLIKDLEQQIGFELFARKQGRVYPNAAAHELFSAVKQQYAALHSVDDAVKGLSGDLRKVTNIASLPSFASTVLPTAVASRKLSKHHFSIRTVENEDMKSFLHSHPDFLCISSDFAGDPGVETEIVIETELVCAMPRLHPLSSKETVDIGDLHGRDVARVDQTTAVFNQIDVVFEKYGVKPISRFRTTRSDVLYSLVETSGCCAIVEPFGFLKCDATAVAIRPLAVAFPLVFRFATMPYDARAMRLAEVKEEIRRTAANLLRKVLDATRT